MTVIWLYVTLTADVVYQAFVLPEYQAQKARAERLAAKLQALGVAEAELD